MTGDASSWGRRILFEFILLNLIIPLTLAELGVRYVYTYWKPAYTPVTLRQQYIQYDPSIFSQHVISQHESITDGWGGVSYFINALGYRGPAFKVTKPPHVTRIVFLGGSSVFDTQADKNEDWPHLIEKRLHEKGYKDIECINAGVPGHTTFDLLGRLYSEIYTFQPDYIVVYSEWNDIKYFTSDLTLLRDYKPTQTDYRFNYYNQTDSLLCEYSQLYTKVRNRYVVGDLDFTTEGTLKTDLIPSSVKPEKLKQYKLNLELLVDCARNIHATPVLVTEAHLPQRNSSPADRKKIGYSAVSLTHEALCEAFEACDRIVEEVAREKGSPFIDASKEFSGRSEIFIDHVHLMPSGSHQLADFLSDQLIGLFTAKEN